MKAQNLHDLFIMELQDLYDAEQQIINALPTMINKASHSDLKQALEEHLTVTQEQVSRLQQIAKDLDINPKGKSCKGMEGIISEGEKLLKDLTSSAVTDAAIIAAAQKVEHYEIAGYGTALAYAREMNHQDAANLLEQTLEEESDTDEQLTSLATGGLLSTGINEQASESSDAYHQA